MLNITEFIDFCNNRNTFHKRKAKKLLKFEPDSKYIQSHLDSAKNHEGISEWFSLFQENPNFSNDNEEDIFSINPLDLEGLDEEIRVELSLSESDVFDAQIIQLLKIAGRPLDLNELIIGSFRKFNTKYKRTQLTARIHKLIAKGLISVHGKGVYRLVDTQQLNEQLEDT